MAEFLEAVELNQLPVGSGTSVMLNGKNIALFNVDGNVYAIDDGCLHHGSSLGSGLLEGKIVTCRSHGWKYNVTTGGMVNVPDYGVKSYPVKIEDGKILVEVS